MTDLKDVYQRPDIHCDEGHKLRQREWGILSEICTHKCDTCVIRNRKTKESDG
jgi:hypothetical protein